MINITKPSFELNFKLEWYQKNAPESHSWSKVLPQFMEINEQFPVGKERDKVYLMLLTKLVREFDMYYRFEIETKYLIAAAERTWEKLVVQISKAELALIAMLPMKDTESYWKAMDEIEKIDIVI